MQYQPPQRNNPANPLFKVAALSLEKVPRGATSPSQSDIVARLNFKWSDDLKGTAKTATGDPVTVSFSLGLRRATFELSLVLNDGRSKVGDHLTIRDVAFHRPLAVQRRVNERLEVNSLSVSESGLVGTGALTAETSGFDGGLQGRATVARQTRENKQIRSTVDTAFAESNISVTLTDDRIHWEICSATGNDDRRSHSRRAHLSGEVFFSAASDGTPACTIEWRRDNAGPLVVRGSVFALMESLDIRDVRFLNEVGDEIRWNQIDRSDLPRSTVSLTGMLSRNSQLKQRLVRQIVRKHLVSQGMSVEGARVEICQAFT